MISGALMVSATASAEKITPPEKWDVLTPPEQTKSITINTTETTWSNLDVSPDGKHIIFDMLGDLYLLPINGGEASPLLKDNAWNIQPKFSPDGKQVAFISDRNGAYNLWLMNADGSNLRQITKEPNNAVHNPYWSPDGNYIAVRKAYMGARSIAGGSVWMYHKTGGKGVQLRDKLHAKQPQKNLSEPAFSPDGKYVYFSLDATSGQRWEYGKNSVGEIFEIRKKELATGEETTVVSGAGGAIRPIPSPDGKKLAFVRRIHMQSALYIKDLRSGIEKQVYLGLDRDLQEANGEHGNTPAFDWTPDGDSLVFWAAGKFHKLSAETHKTTNIPMHINVEKQVTPAVRFAVDVAPDTFKVKMARWSQLSPNGKYTVFQALGHLYIKNNKSGKTKRLTKQKEHLEYYPSFSPDGKYIVYTTWDDQELGSIKLVKTRGGRAKTLSTDPGHYISPRFSQDGKHITYEKVTGGYLLSGDWSMEPGIYTMSIKEKMPKLISRSGNNPHFSADQKRVFFTSDSSATETQLHSINVNGQDKRTHYKGEYITDYLVSPDGKWVAFIQDYNIFIAPFISTGDTLSLGKKSQSFPVSQASNESGEFLNWSHDSQSVTWGFGPKLYQKSLHDSFAFLTGKNKEDIKDKKATAIDITFEQQADKPEGLTALVGGNIVTMRNADVAQEVIKNGVVLIKDNRITEVGAQGNVTIPKNAKVIDVSGKTLIPGLVDVHAHGSYGSYEIQPEQNWNQFSNLAFGVTTIHDPSTSTTEVFSMSEMVKAGKTVAPRIFSTGRILYAGKANGYHVIVDNYEDAYFHVNRLKEVGAISVKSYAHPQRRIRQQVLTAARNLGMMVVPEGTGKFQLNMNQVFDGHTGVEHAVNVPKLYDDVLQMWSQTDVGYTPTLGVAYGGLEGERYWYHHTNVWENKRLMRYVPKHVVEPVSVRPKKAPEEHYNHIKVAESAKALRDKGVRVLLGAHGQREGLAAHWELWMLQQGGFSAWEALRAGTIDGAIYLGLDKDVGSIEAGKLADIAVIDGDVLSDLRRSEFVTYTIINGRVYDTKTMNEIGTSNTSRQPFFFELSPNNNMHPNTKLYMEEKAEKYHWKH